MTDDEYESEHDSDGESRQSFTRKGALAAGGLALGAAASSTVAAQDDDDGDALVFAYDYIPGQDFEVLSQLDQSTTVQVLQLDDEEVDEISSPDEYNGYAVRYNTDADTAGTTTFVFLRDETLDTEDTETFEGDATMFSSDLNLLSDSLE
ncbi:hypothetical protein ACFOZ7_22180 [Natribaculum luteum]|uniref:Calcium-binding protein n=1 Tax=Natribaculum luteum TaxID=1586232 RepID=A0ABD5P648_9EURY|nr:calcium-binding protein [Natribaculum luteum]